MDNPAWDRCSHCLGLLEPLEADDNTAALGCCECGYLSPERDAISICLQPTEPVASLPGF